jgi:hypothetical protein
MKSRLGFFGAIAFLAAMPLALLANFIFGGISAELVIHFACGTGFVLCAMAMFDFPLPRWMTWIGSLATGAVGIIFLLQGVSNLMPDNEGLSYFVFQVLGQGLEGLFIDLFFLWLVAVLIMDSQGKTRVLGFFLLSIVVALEVYRIVLISSGGDFPVALKLVYFLPIIWFLFESKKKISLDTLTPKRSSSSPA